MSHFDMLAIDTYIHYPYHTQQQNIRFHVSKSYSYNIDPTDWLNTGRATIQPQVNFSKNAPTRLCGPHDLTDLVCVASTIYFSTLSHSLFLSFSLHTWSVFNANPIERIPGPQKRQRLRTTPKSPKNRCSPHILLLSKTKMLNSHFNN